MTESQRPKVKRFAKREPNPPIVKTCGRHEGVGDRWPKLPPRSMTESCDRYVISPPKQWRVCTASGVELCGFVEEPWRKAPSLCCYQLSSSIYCFIAAHNCARCAQSPTALAPRGKAYSCPIELTIAHPSVSRSFSVPSQNFL